MADDKAPDPKAAPPGDEVKNMKAEFDRKLGNFDSKIGNIEATNKALLSQLQILAQAPKKEVAPAPKSQIKDLWYDDPEAAARLIAKSAKDETMQEINAQNAVQAKKGNVIQKLYQEYPELQDFENPLTKKAVELYNNLPPDEQAQPMAYRMAVQEAAMDLDIKPKAKRKPKEEDDNFSLGSGSGGGSTKPRSRKAGELDPKTAEFARLVGLDPTNEKTQANLKKHAERKNWLTWE